MANLLLHILKGKTIGLPLHLRQIFSRGIKSIKEHSMANFFLSFNDITSRMAANSGLMFPADDEALGRFLHYTHCDGCLQAPAIDLWREDGSNFFLTRHNQSKKALTGVDRYDIMSVDKHKRVRECFSRFNVG